MSSPNPSPRPRNSTRNAAGWLEDQILGLRTYAGVLAGESISYADEVERCYGVRPERGSVAVYPGHHTEHAVKEQFLIRDGGHLEEGLQLVPTPQALTSEGIAEAGLGVLLDEQLSRELVAALADQGYDADLDEAMAIGAARRPLGGIGVDAALMIHEEGGTEDDARAYIERSALRAPTQAAAGGVPNQASAMLATWR